MSLTMVGTQGLHVLDHGWHTQGSHVLNRGQKGFASP